MESFNIKDPKQIYSQISLEVENILDKLNVPLEDKALEDACVKASIALKHVHADLEKQIKELESNSEWDTFTIAFYGETNAGKSTIIETLRIVLKETTKDCERGSFRELQRELGLTEERIEALQQSIVLTDTQLRDSRRRIDELQLQIAEKRNAASLWQKLLNYFWKLPEEKECLRLEKQRTEARQQKENSDREFAQLKGALCKLENCADGSIVGDGRSDFTLETCQYEFNHGECKFTLLDMPGIEGNESSVSGKIWQAVQKAHAVFYVTTRAAPPQTGNNENSRKSNAGTLEKIRQHLRDQTEVWTLFNKRITNPLLLEKPELLNEGELGGLKAIDEEMKKHLGDHYQGNFSLSAYPAFLAVADHLPPCSDKLRNRKKFLERFDTPKLLEKTKIACFLDWLRQLPANAPAKIQRSNVNKATALLKNVVMSTIESEAKRIAELSREVARTTKGTQTKLKKTFQGLESHLNSLTDTLVDEYIMAARQEIYACIDRNISNDDFKEDLERIVKRKVSKLEEAFPQQVEQKIKGFNSEVSNMLIKYEDQLKELQEVSRQAGAGRLGGDFGIKLNITDGIQWGGLIASLIGTGGSIAALLAATGVGWLVLAAVGILAGLVAMWKSLRSALSDKYKMEQQRKAADKNLRAVSSQVEEALSNSINGIIVPNLRATIEEIENTLEIPVRQARDIHEVLENTVTGLSGLYKRINSAIAV